MRSCPVLCLLYPIFSRHFDKVVQVLDAYLSFSCSLLKHPVVLFLAFVAYPVLLVNTLAISITFVLIRISVVLNRSWREIHSPFDCSRGALYLLSVLSASNLKSADHNWKNTLIVFVVSIQKINVRNLLMSLHNFEYIGTSQSYSMSIGQGRQN